MRMTRRDWDNESSSADGDPMLDNESSSTDGEWDTPEDLYVLRVGSSLVEIGSSANPREHLAYMRDTCPLPVLTARIWYGAGFLLKDVVEHFSNVRATMCDEHYFYTHPSIVIEHVDAVLSATGLSDLCAEYRSWPTLL